MASIAYFQLQNWKHGDLQVRASLAQGYAASKLTHALEEIKTKRHTYARLRRMAAYTALQITKPILQSYTRSNTRD
ncbi:MAG: nucleotidyltransferase family protein [Veillonella sp.]